MQFRRRHPRDLERTLLAGVVAVCLLLHHVAVPLHLGLYEHGSTHAHDQDHGHAHAHPDGEHAPHPAEDHLEDLPGPAVPPSASTVVLAPPPVDAELPARVLLVARVSGLPRRSPRPPPPRAHAPPRAPPLLS